MNKEFKFIIGLLLCSILISSCEKDIFGPNGGEIIGVVYNNIGVPVKSVKITASIIDATSEEIIATATTNTDGSYELLDVRLGEIQLITEVRGYKEDLATMTIVQDSNSKEYDFTLEGAPEILSVILDKGEISIADNDSIFVSLSTVDFYNSDGTIEKLNMNGLLKNTNDEIIKIYDIETVNDQQYQLFEFYIFANELVAGEYGIEFNAIDKDNIKSNTILKTLIINK